MSSYHKVKPHWSLRIMLKWWSKTHLKNLKTSPVQDYINQCHHSNPHPFFYKKDDSKVFFFIFVSTTSSPSIPSPANSRGQNSVFTPCCNHTIFHFTLSPRKEGGGTSLYRRHFLTKCFVKYLHTHTLKEEMKNGKCCRKLSSAGCVFYVNHDFSGLNGKRQMVMNCPHKGTAALLIARDVN